MSKPRKNKKPDDIDTAPFESGKKWFKKEFSNAKEWLRDQFGILWQGEVKEKKYGRIAPLSYQKNLPPIGRMCYFRYKAKGDGSLPYWDRNPLVIMIGEDKEHFLGLNLHYLPPKYRALLLGRLVKLLNNNKMDKTTYLRVSYQFLAAASKYRWFKPCIKSYLKTHMLTRINFIEPKNWHKAILIPMARFKGASSKRVWVESMRIGRGR